MKVKRREVIIASINSICKILCQGYKTSSVRPMWLHQVVCLKAAPSGLQNVWWLRFLTRSPPMAKVMTESLLDCCGGPMRPPWLVTSAVKATFQLWTDLHWWVGPRSSLASRNMWALFCSSWVNPLGNTIDMRLLEWHWSSCSQYACVLEDADVLAMTKTWRPAVPDAHSAMATISWRTLVPPTCFRLHRGLFGIRSEYPPT